MNEYMLEQAYLEGYEMAMDEAIDIKGKAKAAGDKIKSGAKTGFGAVTTGTGGAIAGGVGAVGAVGALAIRAKIKKLQAQLKKTVNPKKRAQIEGKIKKLKAAMVASGAVGAAGLAAGATAGGRAIKDWRAGKNTENTETKSQKRKRLKANAATYEKIRQKVEQMKSGHSKSGSSEEVVEENPATAEAYLEGYYTALEEMGYDVYDEDYEDYEDDSEEAYLEGYYTALEEMGYDF